VPAGEGVAEPGGRRLGDPVDETRAGRSRATSETFKTGVLNLVYGPAERTGDATYEDADIHLAQPEQ
jgi:hypothetical protein